MLLLTLCAGTRFTKTVSKSSWDTVSPSQIIELMRSTMCIWTFWLWPLLKFKIDILFKAYRIQGCLGGSVKCRTSGLDSGHDLNVQEYNPHMGSTVTVPIVESLLGIFALPLPSLFLLLPPLLPPPPSFSLHHCPFPPVPCSRTCAHKHFPNTSTTWSIRIYTTSQSTTPSLKNNKNKVYRI